MACRPTSDTVFFIFERVDVAATTPAGSGSFGASTSFVPHQHQQAALIPHSVSSVPQQHPQAATVSHEMSLFNNLDRDAKMSRVYEFMFTHMRRLETRLNEVARNTSERFSQIDARLQVLEQRTGEQIVRPHESTAEIVVSSLPTRGQLLYEDTVTRFSISLKPLDF